MSRLMSYEEDWNTPFTEKSFNRILGKINQKISEQSTAASLTSIVWIADFNGVVGDLFVQLAGPAPGVGESMAFDLQKQVGGSGAFASMLSAALTVTSANFLITDVISMYSLVTTGFKEGDVLEFIRTYTLGTDTPMTYSQISLEPTYRKWK